MFKISFRRVKTVILAIESSCDDTSAAVLVDGLLCSNVTASQKVHEEYGGVVPELASRAHQQNIVPVVDTALNRAGVSREQISAIAFTRGPGLLGSLLVGTSFAKGLSLSVGAPLIEVNHLQGHIMAHFVEPAPEMVKAGYIKGVTDADLPLKHPSYPFLCLLVSGGNSQIVLVKSPYDMQIIGQTIDDAAGEAFDKCAKVLGLPYPGGPWIDRLAKEGNPQAFPFAKPNIAGYDYSFSGLKTSFLYTLRDMLRGATELLGEGGRLSVITYHSLEDRIVKNIMKAGNAEGKVEQDFFGRIATPFRLVNKVTTPTDEEQQRNPRSRSAKLRIAEKI